MIRASSCWTSRRTGSTLPDATRCSAWCGASAPSLGSPPSSPATSWARSSGSCTQLLAIDAGHLLRSAPIASFTERTGVLSVEVEEGADALAASLTGSGLEARLDGQDCAGRLPDERPYDIVRDAIVDLDLALVRLEQRRGSLEDLFNDEPSERTDAA